jgi:hypothetical protein
MIFGSFLLGVDLKRNCEINVLLGEEQQDGSTCAFR